MVEAIANDSHRERVAFALSPNRSITAAGLKGFFVVMATFSLAVATFSFSQGNVFAPFFAVAELSLLALCLKLVWRAQNRGERVVIGDEHVEVVRDCDGVVARFNPFWVRVELEAAAGGAGRHRLLLTSHGRGVEVGAFLGDDERVAFAEQLKLSLAARRARPASPAAPAPDSEVRTS